MSERVNLNVERNRPVFRALSGDSVSGGSDSEKTIFVRMTKPSLDDNADDLLRLTDAIAAQCGVEIVSADIDAVRSLPLIARESDWNLKCTISPENECGKAGSGDSSSRHKYFLKRMENGSGSD